MLSLSPRSDLFRIELPKDFIPKEVYDKYNNILSREKGVTVSPIDYLNESIQSLTLPGISDLTITQSQPGSHHPMGEKYKFPTPHLTSEPTTDVFHYSTSNPLTNIDHSITITFRNNQSLYNYFMLYETIFYKICKQYDYREKDSVILIKILNEKGFVMGRIKIIRPKISGLDGMSFNYNNIERNSGTFDLKLSFDNIDFDLVEDLSKLTKE